MDRLSSCYFCGDALDASLDEYPVVPPALASDRARRQTVVLCRGCHRKLDSILDVVLESVDGRDGGVDGATEESSVDDSAAAPTDSPLEGGEDVLRPVGGTTDDGGVDQDDADDGDVGVTGASEGASVAGASEGASGVDDPSDSTAGLDVASDSSGGSEGGLDAARDSSGASDGEPDRDAAGQPENASESSSADTALGDDSVTRLEYNKVMRLLQNREFPVDRDGFVNVAANAYELTRRECEQILDVAIEHGLIAEEEGQLVRPAE